MSSSKIYPKARKRFGQNFLHDQHIISDIISSISPQKDQHLVEIGPGRAALTEPLSQSCKKLDVIELDRDLVPLLRARFINTEHLTIHQADALMFDYSTLVNSDHEQLRVIGNLPYNITTPLLFHLLDHAQLISDMCFMLQKEVVQRICAQPDSKTYGKLSIMVQYQCEVEQLFIVPPDAFDPPPKVDSAIIYLKPRSKMLGGDVAIEALNELVSTAFSQRRKTIANTLKNKVSQQILLDNGIDLKQRPETISVEQYVAITRSWLAATKS
jgi:16S rRNA (adenine1518-N6/adenine1519-N6)-dimethyltransferase